jgi:signal transduction histidine kinase
VLLDGKPVELQIDLAPSLTSTIPAGVLNIVLSNLIGNAFAHAQDGTIAITTNNGRLQISNRAACVDSVTAQRLRDEPYAKREGSAGFGLGLVIVKRLSERFGLDLNWRIEYSTATASFLLSAEDGQRDSSNP